MSGALEKHAVVSAAELEFLAEDTLIEVLPRFTHAPFKFISGTFGPFRPGNPVEVPLWLAVRLKNDSKCNIICPNWMRVEELRETYAQETREEAVFAPLPFHYLEISSLILHAAADDIEECEKVRQLLEDIESRRQQKIRAGISAVLEGVKRGEISNAISLRNASAMEVNSLRSTFMKALHTFSVMGQAQEAVDRTAAAVLAEAAAPGRDIRNRFGRTLGGGGGGGGGSGGGGGGGGRPYGGRFPAAPSTPSFASRGAGGSAAAASSYGTPGGGGGGSQSTWATPGSQSTPSSSSRYPSSSQHAYSTPRSAAASAAPSVPGSSSASYGGGGRGGGFSGGSGGGSRPAAAFSARPTRFVPPSTPADGGGSSGAPSQ